MPSGIAEAVRKQVAGADKAGLVLQKSPYSATGFTNVIQVRNKFQARLQRPGQGRRAEEALPASAAWFVRHCAGSRRIPRHPQARLRWRYDTATAADRAAQAAQEVAASSDSWCRARVYSTTGANADATSRCQCHAHSICNDACASGGSNAASGTASVLHSAVNRSSRVRICGAYM